MTTTHYRREVTLSDPERSDIVNVARYAVADWTFLLQAHEVGATVTPARGFWQGAGEHAVTVTFDWPTDDDAGPYHFRALLGKLAENLPECRWAHVAEYPVNVTPTDLDAYRA